MCDVVFSGVRRLSLRLVGNSPIDNAAGGVVGGVVGVAVLDICKSPFNFSPAATLKGDRRLSRPESIADNSCSQCLLISGVPDEV